MIEIKPVGVESAEYLTAVRQLFREYRQELAVDLSFQKFEEELRRLPAPYVPPGGVILLALVDGKAAGCVALKDLGAAVCEMKRLYVRPAFRGQGLGRTLAVQIIEEAKTRGYRTMRLDTLEALKEAMNLYRKLGFKKIAPYYHNPLPGVVYWQRDLTHGR